MINSKKIIVVLPAYNAEKTLERTVQKIPMDVVDEVFLVDDRSSDRTVELAKELALEVFEHEHNVGYGGNQKTCYREALKRNADVVVMLHPDYQYDPRLIVAIAAPICYGVYDVILGSRILGGQAMERGMPPLKYYVNRLLTFFQNVAFRMALSEYHTGYRAFHAGVLRAVPFQENSDGFLFDNQMLAQIIFHGFQVGEISCPTRYFPDSSSIGLIQGIKYAFGCIVIAMQYLLEKSKLAKFSVFRSQKQRTLDEILKD
ncbi:MAG: glycosyltransferase family 2 protein [Candidatus Omnitrophica bacterium]|nr:glycosyltransferase family 2 protein [Candidatus Omnitrophota bacterium]